VLTVAHGVLFQSVESRKAPWLIAFWLLVAATLGFQAAGFLAIRKRGR